MLGLTTKVTIAAPMLALSGGALTIWNVHAASLRQRLAPADLLGRISSAYLFVGFGAATLGALLGGAVASTLGLRAPFLLGAALPLLLLAPLRRVRVEHP
jgi:MFS family permease